MSGSRRSKESWEPSECTNASAMKEPTPGKISSLELTWMISLESPLQKDLDTAERAAGKHVELDKRGKPSKILGMELK